MGKSRVVQRYPVYSVNQDAANPAAVGILEHAFPGEPLCPLYHTGHSVALWRERGPGPRLSMKKLVLCGVAWNVTTKARLPSSERCSFIVRRAACSGCATQFRPLYGPIIKR